MEYFHPSHSQDHHPTKSEDESGAKQKSPLSCVRMNKENPKSPKSKPFACSFCRREFSTSQALGGHQNAHKHERALAKYRHNMVDITGPHQGYPSSTTLLHSYGGFNSSIFHKPYSYHHSSSASEYVSRNYLMRPSSSSSTLDHDRLKRGDFQSRGLGMAKLNPNSATTKDDEGRDEKYQRLRLGNIVDDGNHQNDDSGAIDLDLKL